MRNTVVKMYSTRCTSYSTVGRKNIRIESECTKSKLLQPKYGRALRVHKAKENINNLFN